MRFRPGILGTALWSGALLLLSVSVLASFGRTHWILANLSHFRLQYAAAGMLLIPGAFFLRSRRSVFVVALLAGLAFNTSYLLPYLIGRKDPKPGNRTSVSVLLWNTWRKNRDSATVNERIARTDADVVILQETTREVRDGLTVLEGTYRVVVSGGDAALIRSSAAHKVEVVRGQPYRGHYISISVGADRVEMLATHLMAPLSAGAFEKRSRQLEAMAAWVNARDSAVVVLGDLNATPWSFEMADLRETTGLEDSLAGRGLQPTWPFHNALTSLLRIPLDHCLHSPEVVIRDRSVGDAEGSNHRPLFVRFALAD